MAMNCIIAVAKDAVNVAEAKQKWVSSVPDQSTTASVKQVLPFNTLSTMNLSD